MGADVFGVTVDAASLSNGSALVGRSIDVVDVVLSDVIRIGSRVGVRVDAASPSSHSGYKSDIYAH
jgi:hypothetical protein